MEIKSGTLFIADSHYNHNRKEVYDLLLKVKNKELDPPQIFLMGDIFDFVCYSVKHFIELSRELVELINELSNEKEIIYLEGNHDFDIAELFPKVKVYTREQQPLVASYAGKKVLLAHGDIFTPLGYDIYTSFIRNKLLMKFVNLINFNGFISGRIYNWLISKNICTKFEDIESFVKRRVELYKSYSADIIIEGHFHQNCELSIDGVTYINLPSLACLKGGYYIIGDK